MCCFVQVTRQWNEAVDTQEHVKSVCYVATLAPSGRKVVGIWLLPMEQTEVGSLRIAGNFETNLVLSDFSFGLCHITEEELKQDKFGSPELIECGSGVFWDPDLECPAAKSLLNFSPAEFEQELQAKQKSEQEAKMLEKKRKKQEENIILQTELGKSVSPMKHPMVMLDARECCLRISSNQRQAPSVSWAWR